jgi:hypothetical protein
VRLLSNEKGPVYPQSLYAGFGGWNVIEPVNEKLFDRHASDGIWKMRLTRAPDSAPEVTIPVPRIRQGEGGCRRLAAQGFGGKWTFGNVITEEV